MGRRPENINNSTCLVKYNGDCLGKWSDCTRSCGNLALKEHGVEFMPPEECGQACPDQSEAPDCQGGDEDCLGNYIVRKKTQLVIIHPPICKKR